MSWGGGGGGGASRQVERIKGISQRYCIPKLQDFGN